MFFKSLPKIISNNCHCQEQKHLSAINNLKPLLIKFLTTCNWSGNIYISFVTTWLIIALLAALKSMFEAWYLKWVCPLWKASTFITTVYCVKFLITGIRRVPILNRCADTDSCLLGCHPSSSTYPVRGHGCSGA